MGLMKSEQNLEIIEDGFGSAWRTCHSLKPMTNMKHEDIVDLWDEISISLRGFDQKVEDVLSPMINQAFEALLSEAWHPIEKAEELGAKDGQYVMIRFFSWDKHLVRIAKWASITKRWLIHDTYVFANGVTHFRFINPPEGA